MHVRLESEIHGMCSSLGDIICDSYGECISFRNSCCESFNGDDDSLRRYPIDFNDLFDFARFWHEWDLCRREFMNIVELASAGIGFTRWVEDLVRIYCARWWWWLVKDEWNWRSEASAHVVDVFEDRNFHEFEEIIVILVWTIVTEENSEDIPRVNSMGLVRELHREYVEFIDI